MLHDRNVGGNPAVMARPRPSKLFSGRTPLGQCELLGMPHWGGRLVNLVVAPTIAHEGQTQKRSRKLLQIRDKAFVTA
jgi:hypothetical protein